jgi:hypothetical protein
MWELNKGGGNIATLLSTTHLHPRRVTLTIHDVESIHWHHNKDLWLAGAFFKGLNEVMSPSIEEFRIEVETVMRSSYPINRVTKNIASKLHFKRRDGVVLYADADAVKQSRRSEMGALRGPNWIKDEPWPRRVHYHVVSVPFRPRDVGDGVNWGRVL